MKKPRALLARMPSSHRPNPLMAFVFLLFFAAYASANPALRLFFIDGVDRKDGMSAVLNTESKTFGIAGDMVLLKDCEGNQPCISSDYMDFYPQPPGAERWTAAGHDYVWKESKLMQVGARHALVDVIVSQQRTESFEFYYERSTGLLGWTMTYRTTEGRLDKDVYLVDHFPADSLAVGLPQKAEGMKVIRIYRPNFYSGAIASWIKIVAVPMDSGPPEYFYLLNGSQDQRIPSLQQICDFTVVAGTVNEAAGDEMLQKDRPAKIVKGFRCKFEPITEGRSK